MQETQLCCLVSHSAPDKDVSVDNRAYFTFISQSDSPLITWLCLALFFPCKTCRHPLLVKRSHPIYIASYRILLQASARGTFWKMFSLLVIQPWLGKAKLKYLKTDFSEGRSVPTVHGAKSHCDDTMLGILSVPGTTEPTPYAQKFCWLPNPT